MAKNDAETTAFVLENCDFKFSNEFIEKLSANSQNFRLSTKYEMLEKAIIKESEENGIEYTQQQINNCASKAYIYAKMISGKFTDIRPKVDSTETITYIIKNYEDGYRFMLEAIFMKIGINNISNYVKGKIDGNAFYTKISNVTSSKPREIKKDSNPNIMKINKIKNLIFEIRTKEDESRWLNSKLERMQIQKVKNIEQKKYNLNYA